MQLLLPQLYASTDLLESLAWLQNLLFLIEVLFCLIFLLQFLVCFLEFFVQPRDFCYWTDPSENWWQASWIVVLSVIVLRKLIYRIFILIFQSHCQMLVLLLANKPSINCNKNQFFRKSQNFRKSSISMENVGYFHSKNIFIKIFSVFLQVDITLSDLNEFWIRQKILKAECLLFHPSTTFIGV